MTNSGRTVRVFMLPQLIGQQTLAENVVVIDVLRASTTICAALKNGATTVVPFLEIEEADRFKAKKFAENDATVLTGGERGGIQIEGFDFGNSPFEYVSEKVSGRTIAFTTTNGTKAMNVCRQSSNVLIGAFCNFSDIARALSSCDEIDLICAGTNGEITLEDCVFAGMVVDHFSNQTAVALNDQASICRQLWQISASDLECALKNSTGGRNLVRLKKTVDVEFAAKIDSIPILPKLDTKAWKIEPA